MKKNKHKHAMAADMAMLGSAYTFGAELAPELGRKEFRNLIKMRRRSNFNEIKANPFENVFFGDKSKCLAKKKKARKMRNRILWPSGRRGTYVKAIHGELK
jgi:hypothetical protein